MRSNTKRGVIVFLDNFIIPLQETIMHYAKLTHAQKSFINTPKSDQQFPLQQIQQLSGTPQDKQEAIQDLIDSNSTENLNNDDLQKANKPSQQKSKITQNNMGFPEFPIIGIINKPSDYSLLPKDQENSMQRQFTNSMNERLYYNIGINIQLMKAENEFMKYRIVPASLTPFVKVKKIQKNEYYQSIKYNSSVPLKLDNMYKPYNSISIDDLDFIVYNGSKLYMCEFEEQKLEKNDFEYIIENAAFISEKLNQIAKKLNFNIEQFQQEQYQNIIAKQQLQNQHKDNYNAVLNNQIMALEEEFEHNQIDGMHKEKFQLQKNIVIQIYQQVLAVFNHIDQKFFLRSKSAEWSDKKYQFINYSINKKVQILEKLANSLQC